jgi:hypothetical protein
MVLTHWCLAAPLLSCIIDPSPDLPVYLNCTLENRDAFNFACIFSLLSLSLLMQEDPPTPVSQGPPTILLG